MQEVTCLILLIAKMSNASKNPLGVSVNSDLLGINNLFDFEAASKEVSSYKYQAIAREEHSNNLFNNLSNNNNSLNSKAVSSAKDVNNKEPSKKEDKLTRANSALL